MNFLFFCLMTVDNVIQLLKKIRLRHYVEILSCVNIINVRSTIQTVVISLCPLTCKLMVVPYIYIYINIYQMSLVVSNERVWCIYILLQNIYQRFRYLFHKRIAYIRNTKQEEVIFVLKYVYSIKYNITICTFIINTVLRSIHFFLGDRLNPNVLVSRIHGLLFSNIFHLVPSFFFFFIFAWIPW